MNKSASNIVVGISGGILLVLTVIIFLLVGPLNSGISWVSLVFLLISEMLMITVIWRLLNQSSYNATMVVTSGSITIAVIYWLSTLGLTFLANSVITSLTVAIAIELFLAGVVAFLLIMITAGGRKVKDDEQDAQDRGQVISMCEQKIFVLKSNYSNQTYAKQLNGLYEEVKYCDNSVMSQLDTILLEEIEALEILLENADKTDEMVLELLNRLAGLMVKRKAELMISRRGSN